MIVVREKNIFNTQLIPKSNDDIGDDSIKYTEVKLQSGETLYIRRLLTKPLSPINYAFDLRDALSDSQLSDVISSDGLNSKKKIIRLHQPLTEIKLEYTGIINFEWTFLFEDQKFQWSKGLLGSYYCSLNRKPDPSVEICKFIPNSKSKFPVFSILDYNLARFDIKDIRGLEIILFTSLFTFLDMANEDTGPGESPKRSIEEPTNEEIYNKYEHPRMKLQTIDSNTLNISPDLDFESQVKKTLEMLDKNVFVTLHAPEGVAVQSTITVAESAKRRYMKRSKELRDDEDLYLYVVSPDGNEFKESKKRSSKNYVPPSSLTIHLSKWPMPELDPRQPNKSDSITPPNNTSPATSTQSPPNFSPISTTSSKDYRTSFINSLNKLRRGVAKV